MNSAHLTDGLVADVLKRVREQEPDAIAVLLRGSHARGVADVHSDLDVTAITTEEPRALYRTWFADRSSLAPLHVSVGSSSVERWLERGREPAKWALGLAATEEARYLWHTGDAITRLGDPPSRYHPLATPELEDFVEAAVKAARGRATGDPVRLRVSARLAAELTPRLLLSLNAPVVARDRRDALRLALELANVPNGYRDDLATCLGLTAAGDATVGSAIKRLSISLLAFVREHHPEVDSQPGVADCLLDGTLGRHVERAFGAS